MSALRKLGEKKSVAKIVADKQTRVNEDDLIRGFKFVDDEEVG